MADEQRQSYPKIPAKVWWALRKQFLKSLPGKVSPNYLASSLSLTEDSAKTYLGHLKAAGLVGDDQTPTDLANKWRHDDTYPDVCHRIVETIYPQELRDLDSGPEVDKTKVQRWFASHLKVGERAAQHMAQFYALLCEADPAKQAKAGAPREDRPASGQSKTPKQGRTERTAAPKQPTPKERSEPDSNGGQARKPEFHINIQVHVSADASKEQIETVFASMAKHLFPANRLGS